jgi:hypothetical protein
MTGQLPLFAHAFAALAAWRLSAVASTSPKTRATQSNMDIPLREFRNSGTFVLLCPRDWAVPLIVR